jgi:hypothetical protein
MEQQNLLYTKALAYVEEYQQVFFRYGMYIFSFCLYISFLVMSLYFYRPSYVACLLSKGIPFVILVILINCLFAIYLVLYVLRTSLPEPLVRHAPPILLGIVSIIVFLYGYLFFNCSDPIICDGCDTVQKTAFNTRVTEQLSKRLPWILNYYREFSISRIRISQCSKYYTLSEDIDSCDLDPDKAMECAVGKSPPLNSFFICSSYRSVLVDAQRDSYVSDKMIEVVLTGGARLLDFDIFPQDFKKDTIPIVTLRNEKTNKPVLHNYVTLEQCFRIIHRVYYANRPSPPLDPLFLHFHLHKNVSRSLMDTISKMIVYYFQYYNGSLLLDASYNYKICNLGTVPICKLLNKTILLFTSPSKPLNASLSEIANGVTNQYFCKRYSWIDVRDIPSRESFIDYNRYRLSMVFPCNNLFPKNTGKGDNSDDFMTKRYTINNDSILPFRSGCHFIMMNFQLIDTNLQTYLSYFKKTSFVLKPASLRAPPLTYTPPIYRPDGSVYSLVCDQNNALDNPEIKNIYCKSNSQTAQYSENKQLYSESYNTAVQNVQNAMTRIS